VATPVESARSGQWEHLENRAEDGPEVNSGMAYAPGSYLELRLWSLDLSSVVGDNAIECRLFLPSPFFDRPDSTTFHVETP